MKVVYLFCKIIKFGLVLNGYVESVLHTTSLTFIYCKNYILHDAGILVDVVSY